MTALPAADQRAGGELVSARSLNYRALMACDQTGSWLEAVEDQLSSWLRQRKAWDVDVRADGQHASSGRSLDVRHHEDGSSRSLRARLAEPTPKTGTWTTELVAHERAGGGGWISLDVENSDGHFVAVPALAKYLMQVLPLSDGELRFADEPQVFRAGQVDDVMELLCDEERHGLVFVAGTDTNGLPFDAFVSAVKRWTRQVYGLAQVAVLSPAATQNLLAEFGPGHGVAPWTIRTYLPGVDPAVHVDARRHRVLGTASLAEMPDGLVQKILGRSARNHAASRPVPAPVRRVRRTFQRLANQAIVDAIVEETPVAAPAADGAPVPATPKPIAPEPTAPRDDVAAAAERYLAQIELAQSILGVDSLDEPTLRRLASAATAPRTDPSAVTRAAEQIRSQQAHIEKLEDQLGELTLALNDEQLEHAITAEALEKAADEARWLRNRLQEQGNYDAAFTPLPVEAETEYPSSFAELLARLPSMRDRGLVFSGDPDCATGLDEVDMLRKCVHTAWNALLALADYVRARADGAFDNGFDHYVKYTPSGYRQFAPSKFAATETAATMKRYGSERIFPVPTEIDPSGETTMTAHFKLGRIGMVSPRMYCLDDYTRSGRIVIGYIGRHLTNTQTN